MLTAEVNDLITGLEQVVARFISGLNARFDALGRVPGELEDLRATLAAQSTSAFFLCLQIVLVAGITAGAFLLIDRSLGRTASVAGGGRGLIAATTATVAALAIGLAVAHLFRGTEMVLRTLRIWVVVAVGGGVLLTMLQSVLLSSVRPDVRNRPIRLVQMARHLSFVIGCAIASLALVATLRLWRAGPGTIDLIGTGLVGIPTFLLLADAVWRHRRTMAGAVAGPRPRSRWRNGFARAWPLTVIGLLIFIIANAQIAKTLGTALPGAAVLLTALIVIMTPHLDAMIWNWARRGLDSPNVSTAAAAWRQTARFTVVIIMVTLLGGLWATTLATGFGLDLRLIVFDAFKVALILLTTAFLWNVISAMIDRISRAEHQAAVGSNEAVNTPHSRLGTLVPLLEAVGKSIIGSLALLSILVTMGVNVWPLITGLSFFGLAVSFGSQAVVKDVVSGLFFLLDDAFRFGEYIETSNAKGTVEKVSIRSVSLRDSRGSLATVPFGQIGKIQNFSRGWVIEKLAFRVAFDTDVELVRELLKQIGQDIAADPVLSPDLLEPFSSQGIADVEDGALIIHAQFTAKPGKQSMIRRAALKAVHRAFRKNGILTVPKHPSQFENNLVR